MKIQILGTGCPKCKALGETAEAAAKELGLSYQLEKVSEIDKIVAFGVMSTPALAVDGKVRISGKVPSLEAMKELLASA